MRNLGLSPSARRLLQDTAACPIRRSQHPSCPSSFRPIRSTANTHMPFTYHVASQSHRIHTSAPPLRRTASSDNPPDEPPPTDFTSMDVLGNTPAPSTSVDVCMYDGFGLNSGIRIGDGNGALLVNGEAFEWRPWEVKPGQKMELLNAKGQFDVPREAWGIFEALWPRPDMLVIGTGKSIRPLSPQTRQHIASLGLRVEIADTRNAAAQFNLLATERGVSEIAGALIPIGWQEGIGAK